MLKQYVIDQLFPQMSNLYGSSSCFQAELLPMEKNFDIVFPSDLRISWIYINIPIS